MNAEKTGLLYELRAAVYLKKQGLRILNRRFRAADGEIDLIARDGDTVVFIEVKARPQGALGSGMLAVTADKRRRVRHAASAWMLKKGGMDAPCRFDILEFTRAGIQYRKNAF